MIKRLSILLVFLLSLSACASQEIHPESISEHFSGLNAVTMEATVTTNSGAVIKYDVLFTRSADGDKVTILSPESLAGVSATVLFGKAGIAYDGAYVETLLPYISGYAPIDGLSGVLRSLADEVPDSFGFSNMGGETITLTYSGEADDMSIEKTVWLSRADNSIVRAEFYLEGDMIMEIDVSSYLE